MRDNSAVIFIVFCQSIVILSLILVFGFNFNINETFIGSLLGASISGLFAVYVFNKGKVQNEKEKLETIKENFNKSYVLIDMWSNSTFGTIKSIKNSIENRNLDILNRENYALKEVLDRLNQINDDYIPSKIYKDFLDFKAYIDYFYNLSSAYYNGFIITQTKAGNVYIPKDSQTINSVKEYLINDYQSLTDKMYSHLNSIKDFHDNLNSK